MTPYLRAANVKDGELDLTDVKEMNFDPGEQQIFRLQPGDVLISEGAGSLAAVGASAAYEGEPPGVCFQNTLLRLRPRADVEPRFVAWWARAMYASGEFARFATGASIYHLGAERVRAVRAWIPTIEEQRRIAAFLDAETERIDQLIATKTRMIELLEERTVSEREATVTRGSASSPIPSLPLVPEHWRVLRNKVFTSEITDLSVDGTEELLTVSHITGVTPRAEKNVYMTEAESHIGYKRVQPGDLVINTMWAWMGAAGVSAHAGIVSPAYGVYRFDRSVMLPAFYDVLVRSPGYVKEMTRYSRGVWTSRLRLYPEEFLGLFAPVPPLDEQGRLAESFHDRRRQAEGVSSLLREQIELLRERRGSLITAAVSGEMEVP